MHNRLFATALLLAGSLSAQVIYDNGPIVTNPTGGFGGAPVSVLQTAAPLNFNIFGYSATGAFSLADDFAIIGGASITDIEVFGYLTNNPAPAITGVFLEVYNGDPNAGGVPVAGSPGFANNLVGAAGVTVTTTPTGVYRALVTTPTNSARLVQSCKVTLAAPIVLGQGIYWLRYNYTGMSFCPPITVLNQYATGNAQQWQGASWVALTDGLVLPAAPQGLPFRLHGASATVPGSLANTGLPPCGAVGISVAGAPNAGGFVRTELTGVTGLGLIGYGFSTTPTGFCTCVVGHEWASVVIGTATSLTIPMTTIFAGTNLRIQGADLGGAGGCPFPPVAFSDTHQLHLQ
jgi:hypothetical protein